MGVFDCWGPHKPISQVSGSLESTADFWARRAAEAGPSQPVQVTCKGVDKGVDREVDGEVDKGVDKEVDRPMGRLGSLSGSPG